MGVATSGRVPVVLVDDPRRGARRAGGAGGVFARALAASIGALVSLVVVAATPAAAARPPGGSPSGGGPSGDASKASGVRLAQAAVASIASVDRALFRVETAEGTGSAFQYRTPGYVLTNRHVVSDIPVGGEVTLRPVRTAADGRAGVGEPFAGKVRFKHADLDVAVIEIPVSVSRVALLPIVFPGGRHLPRGIEMFAHGFPGVAGGRSEPTISRGMLSAHQPDTLTGEVFYLTDTALSPGSSGGPVTDAAGSVIGIATAVSVVANGAGNSWGYVLPIKTIDAALSTARGFSALPRAFEPERHVRSIRAAARADAALAAYRAGIEDAAACAATPADFTTASNALIDALVAVDKPLAPAGFEAFNDATIAVTRTMLARQLEFQLTSRSKGSLAALVARMKIRPLQAWLERVVTDAVEAIPEVDRFSVVADLIGVHAAAVTTLLATAPGSCALAVEAAMALKSETSTRRDSVKDFARALASLAATRRQLTGFAFDDIDVDDATIPLRVRQRLRTLLAGLHNSNDEWDALPEACRSITDTVLADGATASAPRAAPPSRAAVDEPAREERSDADGDDEFTRRLRLWTDAGFSRWGAVMNGVLVDGKKSYGIAFDEAPAMVWIGTRAPAGLALTVRLRGPDGAIDASGRAQQGSIEWSAFEVEDGGDLVVDVTSSSRTGSFALAVVHRSSPLAVLREHIGARLPGFEEVGHRSHVLAAGATEEFTFDARDWAAFRLHAVDVQRHDVDLVLLDDKGEVVSSDVDEDHYPAVGVVDPRPVRYLFRLQNPTASLVFVDTIVFGRPRATKPAAVSDDEPAVDWQRRTVGVTGSARAPAGAGSAPPRLVAERAAKVDALKKIVGVLRRLRVSDGRRLVDALGEDGLASAARGMTIVHTKHFPDGSVDVVAALPLAGLDGALAPLLVAPP
jgi:S1-C subfamily serine protease